VHIGVYGAALVAAVSVDFHSETKTETVPAVQFITGRRPVRNLFSWGSRHHCPMEVGAYDIDITTVRPRSGTLNIPRRKIFAEMAAVRFTIHSFISPQNVIAKKQNRIETGLN